MARYTDQQIRDKGFLYIPKQEYLQKPFEIPIAPVPPVVNEGIVNTNAFVNSGGGGEKGLQAMRIMFQHLGANVIAREILTTYEKPLSDESANKMIDQLVKLTGN